MRHKILLFSILILFTGLKSFGQSPENELKKADSLFQIKKFTQSLDLYQSIAEKGYTSPSMLLKMGYIYEGLEDYPKAIFYLSKLNKKHPNDALHQKIITLAVNHNLNGYDESDDETLALFFSNTIYYTRFLLLIVMVTGLILAFLVSRVKTGAVTFSIAAVVWGLSFIPSPKTQAAVIWTPHTYAMQQNSAAAKVVTIVPEGDRFIIEAIDEHWVKLKDGNQAFYVKRQHVKLI